MPSRGAESLTFDTAGGRFIQTRRGGAAVASDSITVDGVPITAELTPLGSYVLLKKKEKMSETPGGVLLPADTQESQMMGQVIAVGNGSYDSDSKKKRTPPVKKGQWVLYGSYDGSEVEYKGEDCVFVEADKLLAVAASPEATPDTFEPLTNFVLVRLIDPPKQSTGGLFLVSGDSAGGDLRDDSKNIGQVVKACEKTTGKDSVEVKAGDYVKWGSFATKEILGRKRSSSDAVNGKDNEVYAAVRIEDLIAKWK